MKPTLKIINGGKPPLPESELLSLLQQVCDNKKPLRDLIAALYPDTQERIAAFYKGKTI